MDYLRIANSSATIHTDTDSAVLVIYLSDVLVFAFFLSSAGWWQNASGQIESPGVSELDPGPGTYWWPNMKRQRLKLSAVLNGFFTSSHLLAHCGEAAGVWGITTALTLIMASTGKVNQAANITQSPLSSLSSCKQEFVQWQGMEITNKTVLKSLSSKWQAFCWASSVAPGNSWSFQGHRHR